MKSAWEGLGLPTLDGVVTVDAYAVAAALEAISPIESEAYGRVTADNIVRTLLVDAYRDYPDAEANQRRQGLNAQFQSSSSTSSRIRGSWSGQAGHLPGAVHRP